MGGNALWGGEPDVPLPEEEPQTPAALLADLDAWLVSTIDIAERLASEAPSRELSLVKTKLEEAQMWLGKVELPTPNEGDDA